MTLGTSFAIREQPTTCTTLPTWKVSPHRDHEQYVGGFHYPRQLGHQ